MIDENKFKALLFNKDFKFVESDMNLISSPYTYINPSIVSYKPSKYPLMRRNIYVDGVIPGRDFSEMILSFVKRPTSWPSYSGFILNQWKIEERAKFKIFNESFGPLIILC